MTKHADRLRWWWMRKVKYRLWSAQNWLKGYKFGPIQRHRCCQHTTPSHYEWCEARYRLEDTIHRPRPGPQYWDWRCLLCGEPVAHHPNLRHRTLARLRARFGTR